MKKLTIAIDFDGTIVTDDYPEMGIPLPYAVDTIRFLRDWGHTIIINTCRSGEYAEKAKAELKLLGIPYHFFNENDPQRCEKYGSDTRKISADVYIDDKDIYHATHDVDWLNIAYIIGKLSAKE